MGVRLYPPILEGTLPAFYLSSESNGEEIVEGCGTIRIPFSYNRAVSANDIDGARAKIKTVQNDAILGEAVCTVNKSEQVAEIKVVDSKVAIWDDDEKKYVNPKGAIGFKIGTYYKVQLAFVHKDSTIGYYSTVGVIKCTGKPIVEINQLTEDTINSNINFFTGKYSCPDDINEKVYSSYFEIKDASSNVIFKSEEGVNSYKYQDDDYVSISDITYGKDLPKDEICTITYNVKTINGLEFSSPIYRIIQRKLIPMDFKGSIIATENSEDGYVNISLVGRQINGMQEISYGKFVLVREDSLDPGNWVELTRFKLNYEYPTKNIFRDFTVEHGKIYTYAIQQFNDNDVYSEKKKSNSVHIEFEDMFLYDGTRQLKVRFNPQVSSFKLQVSESRNDTIGSKYPFFFRNAKIGYKTFPISGLISMQMDENEFFLTYEEIGKEDLRNHRHDSLRDKFVNPDLYKHTDLLDQNFMSERLFKMEVLEWLNDGHVKLFKSPGEGNYLVRLMDTSLSPNTTVGRMLHTFNSTAYECAEIDYANLVKYGIITDTSTIETDLNPFLQWQEDTIYSVEFSKVNNKNYKYAKYSSNLLEKDGIIYGTNIIRLMDLLPGTLVTLVFDEGGGRKVDQETNIITWSPENVDGKDKVEIIIGSTGNYFADDVGTIYGIYLHNTSDQNFYPSNNIHLSYAVEGTINTTFGLIKDIKSSDNNLIQFVGSKDYNLIRSNSSYKDSIPYVNFVNLYKRPVEYLYYKVSDADKIKKYKNLVIFDKWRAVHDDLTDYPFHFIYDEKGYRQLSSYYDEGYVPELYWDPECRDKFSDEESQEYSPFSIYVVRPASFNGEDVLEHLFESAAEIDREDDIHENKHWFEEYYVDRLAKAYTAEDYLTYCSEAVTQYLDHYIDKNFFTNGNFEHGISEEDNQYDTVGGNKKILYENLWEVKNAVVEKENNSLILSPNFEEGSTETSIAIGKGQSQVDNKKIDWCPILKELKSNDKVKISFDLKVTENQAKSVEIGAYIKSTNNQDFSFDSSVVSKKNRWINFEGELIVTDGDNSGIYIKISSSEWNKDAKIYIRDLELHLVQDDIQVATTSDDVLILDAWTGELQTIENFDYNPSAYIDYINKGLDDLKNKIDLREIEYYPIQAFTPEEDIDDIQIGNGVYGDFCCQINTTIYDVEENIDKWRAAKELKKIDLNLWRIDSDETPYYENGVEIGKDDALVDSNIKERLNGYLDNRYWERETIWTSSNNYWNDLIVDELGKLGKSYAVELGAGTTAPSTDDSDFIDWSFGHYKRILDAENYSYEKYNELLEQVIDGLVNPKVDSSVIKKKGGN